MEQSTKQHSLSSPIWVEMDWIGFDIYLVGNSQMASMIFFHIFSKKNEPASSTFFQEVETPQPYSSSIVTIVNFSSCQRNLIKTFQIEAMTAQITKHGIGFFMRLVKWPKIAVKKNPIF